MGIPFYPPRLKITKPSVVYGKDYAVLADLDVQPLFENRWNHRLPHGEVTMMLGHGGIGKSLLTCQLAAWMTRGTPLPEEESRRPPGYVCAVTLEDSLAVWKDRFIAAGGDPSRLPSALIGRPAPATELPPLAGLMRDGKETPGISAANRAAISW